MNHKENNEFLSAAEIANYVVCPEAWRLKRELSVQKKNSLHAEESKALRATWVKKQDLSTQLKLYAKVTYTLLVLLAIVVFLLDAEESDILHSYGLDFEIARFPFEILVLFLLLGLLIVLWDMFDRKSKGLQKKGGLGEKSVTLALQGSEAMPGKLYESNALGLSSTPHAVIRENGSLIPVDVFPMGKKVRDRHVVQLLAHLRLIEDIEGQRPPYGILLIRKDSRTVRVKYTDEKRRWLETLIDEMRSILRGVPAIPTPAKFKCKNCDVNEICSHSLHTPRT